MTARRHQKIAVRKAARHVAAQVNGGQALTADLLLRATVDILVSRVLRDRRFRKLVRIAQAAV